MSSTTPSGQIMWHDLTVANAEDVRDFYADVVGWTVSEVPMDGYADYGMHETADGEIVAGVCHARGSNASIPPQWLLYVGVADLDLSLQRAVDKGGSVIDGPRAYGTGRFAIVKDPAGAVMGLYSEKA